MAAPAEAPTYIFADDIAGLAEARQAEQAAAWAVVQGRAEAGQVGAEQEFVPVDALSTAKAVHEAKAIYGEGSAEEQERYSALLLDCERLVAEWWRKMRPEHFKPVRHKLDEPSGDYFSNGFSVARITSNALVPMPQNPEEERRRVNERVEDATPRLIRSLGNVALKNKVIRTVSECPDGVIDAFAADQRSGEKHQGYGGYVPEIEKLIVRDATTDKQTGDRFVEQVALPGTFMQHSVVQVALERRGLRAEGMDKTDLHGAQILADDDLMEFVALLDQVAGEQWATNVFMGEEVPQGFVKDYAAFREEARIRQEGQKQIAQTVASFVWELAGEKVGPRKAAARVEKYVKMLLLDECKKDFGTAMDMFDEKTAVGLQQVAALEAAGRTAEAFELMLDVQKNAPGGGYCGAGSCGIERVDENSEEGQRVKEELDAEDDERLVLDTERPCKECDTKGKVFMLYSPTKVKKLCGSCGAKDIKKTPFTPIA